MTSVGVTAGPRVSLSSQSCPLRYGHFHETEYHSEKESYNYDYSSNVYFHELELRKCGRVSIIIPIYNFVKFLFKNICCGLSLKLPQRGSFNVDPQHMFGNEQKFTIKYDNNKSTFIWKSEGR